jgi:hypothetical protein
VLKRLLKVLSARPVATGAVAMGLLGTSVGAGVTVLAPPGGGGGDPGLANLWMDSDGGTCTRSASLVAYVNAAACGDLDTAITAASCGDTINIKQATYGQNNVDVDKSSCTSGTRITIQAEESSSCSFSSRGEATAALGVKFQSGLGLKGDPEYGMTLGNSGSAVTGAKTAHLHFKCIGVGNLSMENPSDIILEKVDLSTFYSGGVATLTLNKVDVGPWDAYEDGDGFSCCQEDSQVQKRNSVSTSDIVIKDSYFHDHTNIGSQEQFPGQPGLWAHIDCLQFLNGVTITLERNTFESGTCTDTAFLIKPDQPPISGLTVRNNVIGANGGGGAWTVQIATDSAEKCGAVKFWNNLMAIGGAGLVLSCADSGSTAYNNRLPGVDWPSCLGPNSSNISYDYNKYTGGGGEQTCGTNIITGTPTFLSDGYHLDPADTVFLNLGRAGSAGTDFPSDDIDGDVRTSRPSVGVDEG